MSSAPYASRPTTTRQDRDSGSGALVAVVAIMLGILVGVLGIFALLMWIDARNHNDANGASSMADMPGMTTTPTGSKPFSKPERDPGSAPNSVTNAGLARISVSSRGSNSAQGPGAAWQNCASAVSKAAAPAPKVASCARAESIICTLFFIGR